MIIPKTKLNLRWSWKLTDAKIDRKVNRALKRAHRKGKTYAEVYFPNTKMEFETAHRLHGRLIEAGYQAYHDPFIEEQRRFKIHIQESSNND